MNKTILIVFICMTFSFFSQKAWAQYAPFEDSTRALDISENEKFLVFSCDYEIDFVLIVTMNKKKTRAHASIWSIPEKSLSQAGQILFNGNKISEFAFYGGETVQKSMLNEAVKAIRLGSRGEFNKTKFLAEFFSDKRKTHPCDGFGGQK